MILAGVVVGPALARAGTTATPTAYTFSTVQDFDGYISGGSSSPLAIDAAGDLFGDIESGGPGGSGSVFKIAAGTRAVSGVVSFSQSNAAAGYFPLSGVFSDAAGDLTGSTVDGGTNGTGTVFQVPAGSNTPQTIFNFGVSSNGPNMPAPAYPSGLTPNAAGDLYGVGNDTIFVLNHTSRTLSTAYAVTNVGGFSPSPGAAPVIDKFGNVFGTTVLGPGNSTRGSVYRFTPNASGGGTYDTLYAFTAPVDRADFSVSFDSGGNLYVPNGNSILEISAAQTLAVGTAATTTVFTFPSNASGNYPDGAGVNGGLLIDSAGDIFGTTSSGGVDAFGDPADGTVFEILAGSHQFVLFKTFFDGNSTVADGGEPAAGLTMDAQGDLYGTTTEGGASISHGGTLFELTPVAVPEPAAAAVVVVAATFASRRRCRQQNRA